MKAIVQDVYGSADVLELRDIDQPSIGPGEVLVQVRAAGVDPGVWIFMTGRPYMVRLATGLRRPRAGMRVRGRDLAGVVTAVGANVTRFQPGDEVFGTSGKGTYAEYVAVREDRLAPKPRDLSFEQAGVVPISGGTALQAVRDAARVKPGQRVMVIGAAGGVGAYAVQIAKAYGARVTGVCGPGKADLVRSIGAEDVIDYTRAEVDRDGPVYDVIIDTAGNRPLSLVRRALAPRGTLVLVGGGHATRKVTGGFEGQMLAPLRSMFGGQRLRGLAAKERVKDLEELTRLIESGDVTPVIDRSYPLAAAADAMRYFAQGHPAGKVVITV